MIAKKVLENSNAIQANVEGLSMQQLKLRCQILEDYPQLSFDDVTAIAKGDKKLADFGIPPSCELGIS